MTGTIVLRLCGQLSGGPRGVFDQLKTRMRSPISPPPARKARSESEAAFVSEPGLLSRSAPGGRFRVSSTAIASLFLRYAERYADARE
jgi:hypothetical protein